jgi:hypothetical protein
MYVRFIHLLPDHYKDSLTYEAKRLYAEVWNRINAAHRTVAVYSDNEMLMRLRQCPSELEAARVELSKEELLDAQLVGKPQKIWQYRLIGAWF